MKWFKNEWINFIPLIMFFILFGMYVLAQFSFIECKEGLAVCDPIKPEYIFSTPPSSKVFTEDKLIQSVERRDGLTEDEIKKETQMRKVVADRYNGRLIAMFLILANILFYSIGLFIFFFLIKKSLNYKSAAKLIALSLIVGIFLSFDKMPLMKPIIDNTIKTLAGGMPGIVSIIRAINTFAYATTLAFVFTLCAILYSGNSNENKTEDEDLESSSSDGDTEKEQSLVRKQLQNLSNKKEDLETALYIATFLLIIGVLRANAIGNWSLAFMTPETVEIAKSFLTHLTTVLGGFFTLLLTVTYIPAIYIIQQRGKILLDKIPKSETESFESFEKKDFTFSLKESFPRVIAIIAPLLTGSIAELFNNLPPQ